jgi:hypothetical protein
MSEKQAKLLRQEARLNLDLTASITFNREANGNVSCHGHIGNPIAAFDILGKGCIALASFYAKQAQQAQSRIIQPNLADLKVVGKGN